jgi:ATP-dependent RNA helicase SUPV3L1/SUV3
MDANGNSGPSPGLGGVTAVLGPTNTGKTYLAMDRMLGHASGMIGFPLRLLARENYDRVVKARGAGSVALITGEEKIVPPNPRYYVCTVESMPLDRQVAFLAIDEIQLAADPDRGHIFTKRLLEARGTVETMFLGAETIKPLIRRLVPRVNFVSRPRFSKLAYAGQKKLTRLPRRSAVVAFSVSEVYGIAELIRRHRGGAAVVMGALSPRTRNAQVALYQSGDVDYMVATDAIGMGLNMDVDHVAFASLKKFDGRGPRPLAASEIAQIAGRAGRHMNDGTFGVTADAPALDPDVIARVESHEFPALKSLFWRNTDLRFTTLESLLTSLKLAPPAPGLMRPPPAEDQLVLETMTKDKGVRSKASGPERLKLLWEIAQVPDFRKARTEIHAQLLTQLFNHLTAASEILPEDWFAKQVERVNRIDGDMHVLMDRIAAVRIWTYISHRGGWLQDGPGWQERTRRVEDRLSDALHDKLTAQFVDSRTAHLVKRLKDDDTMAADIGEDGSVEVDGHKLGMLDGLRFKAERAGTRTADRAVLNAANASLRPIISGRVDAIEAAENDAFELGNEAQLFWNSVPVAKLIAGADQIRPQVQVSTDDLMDASARGRLEARLRSWVTAHIEKGLAPLAKALKADVPGAVRGIVFQLSESLGAIRRSAVEEQLKSLKDDERKTLARLGIRFGVEHVFFPALLKAAPIRLRALLWTAAHRDCLPPPLPEPGRVSIALVSEVRRDFYSACGYQPIGEAGYRIDMLERFAAEARRLSRDKNPTLPSDVLSLLGIDSNAGVEVLRGLGFKAALKDEKIAFSTLKTRQRSHKNQTKSAPKPDSPFSKLKDLTL